MAVPWSVELPALVSTGGAVWAASADCRITARWRASKELSEDLWLVLFPAAERSWPDERDWSWGFDLVSCRLSVSGNFLFCFQMYSEIDQKKHPPQLNKIESNNKPTVIFQPVQSWDPWGVVVFQSWSRTAKGSWAWGYCCCSLSVCSEATERSLDLWGVKKHLSHVLRPWSLCKLQRKEKSLVCGSRTDASPWQERLWQVHPC